MWVLLAVCVNVEIRAINWLLALLEEDDDRPRL